MTTKEVIIDFGILKEYIEDTNITDIMYSDNEVWVEHLEKGHFKLNIDVDLHAIVKITRNLAHNMNQNFNEAEPILDAEYRDLRINAIHDSLTSSTLSLSIRKTPVVARLNKEMLLKTNYTSINVLNLLEALIDARCNIIIAGETGSGKTELLKYLFKFTRNNERTITIEDTLETRLKDLYPYKNIISLKSNNKISFSDLIRTSLRQKPNWLLISETRSEEIKDMLNSIATGHSIITTIHAESAENIIYRMMFMLGMTEKNSTALNVKINQFMDIGIYIHKSINEFGINRRILEIVEFYNEKDNNIYIPRSNTLYKINLSNSSPIYNKIISQKILNKLKLRNTDISNIKKFI